MRTRQDSVGGYSRTSVDLNLRLTNHFPHLSKSRFTSLFLLSSMHRGKTGPDPVSCQSCRTKKLRCNRVYPCSNCTSRGISCILPARAGAHRRQNTAETPASVTTESSNEDLSKRIERLEAIVLQSDSNHVASYTPGYADRTLQDVQPQQRLALTPVSLETAPPTTFRQDINSDLEYLENVGTREGPLVRCIQSQYPK
jgi:hypothetical protein